MSKTWEVVPYFKELRISPVVPQLFWFPEMELSSVVPSRFLEVDGLHPSVELKREAFGLLSGRSLPSVLCGIPWDEPLTPEIYGRKMTSWVFIEYPVMENVKYHGILVGGISPD